MRCDHHPFDEEISYLRHEFPPTSRTKPRLWDIWRSNPRIRVPVRSSTSFDVISSRTHPPVLAENLPAPSTSTGKIRPSKYTQHPTLASENRMTSTKGEPLRKAVEAIARALPRTAGRRCRAAHRARRRRKTKTPPPRPGTAGGGVVAGDRRPVRASACRRRAALPGEGDPTEPAESAGDTSRSSA